MAERFSVDPEGVRRLARELAAVRSEAEAVGQRTGGGGVTGSSAVDEAVQAFTSVTAKAHTELYGSVDRLSRWLGDVAAGQFSTDEKLSDHVSAGHANRRSDR